MLSTDTEELPTTCAGGVDDRARFRPLRGAAAERPRAVVVRAALARHAAVAPLGGGRENRAPAGRQAGAELQLRVVGVGRAAVAATGRAARTASMSLTRGRRFLELYEYEKYRRAKSKRRMLKRE